MGLNELIKEIRDILAALDIHIQILENENKTLAKRINELHSLSKPS